MAAAILKAEIRAGLTQQEVADHLLINQSGQHRPA
jgi:hypothetical protein